jgi:pimeloyl-ACP methyl ester carboxylesterase
MRRVAALALVAGGTAAAVTAGLLARDRLREGLPGLPKPEAGMSGNGMAYVRWGTGPKTLLWIVGGPGIGFPWGLRLAATAFVLRPFTEAGYTCWLVDRKRDMPTGYTIPDMAEDYAALIADELGGKVDLVLGEDYGGMIGYYLAARHPDRLGYLANASSGYAVSQQGRAIDHDIATLIGEGRPTEAFARVLGILVPDLRVPGLAMAAGAVMGRLFVDRSRPDFASNLMVETEAEVAYDAREVLPDIPIPVLLIGGDRGPYFTREILEETARLIPDCTLRIYGGKGDAGAVSDRRLARDVLDFVEERSRAVPAARVGLPIVAQGPVIIEEPIPPVEPAAVPIADLVEAGGG